jgi:hypothetical protein
MIKLLRRIFLTSRAEWFLLLVFFFAGCAAKNSSLTLLTGVSQEGAPICLDDQAGIPAFVEQFYNRRDLTTNEGKIDYLLERLRNSELIFIRNRVEYTGSQASGFLRWKLDRWKTRHHIKINTVQEFVNQIAGGSKMSGEPYIVILKNKGRHNLKDILQNELDALEACLKQFPPSVQGQKSTEVSQTIADS